MKNNLILVVLLLGITINYAESVAD